MIGQAGNYPGSRSPPRRIVIQLASGDARCSTARLTGISYDAHNEKPRREWNRRARFPRERAKRLFVCPALQIFPIPRDPSMGTRRCRWGRSHRGARPPPLLTRALRDLSIVFDRA